MGKEALEKKLKHEKVRSNVELSKYNKHGLYNKSSPWLIGIDDHWMYKIDLYQVNLNLMMSEEQGFTYHTLPKRVVINFTKEACGRGGEGTLQNCSECNYNNYFRILGRRWFDMKTF